MNFSPRTAFTVAHRYCIVVFSFLFVSRYLLISSLILLLTHSFFNNMLFSLHVFVCFAVFSCNQFLVFYHCSQRRCLYDFNLIKFIETCFVMWSILENVPCALEKNIYSAALRWNALKRSVKLIWSSVSFKAAVFLSIFCLEDLSTEAIWC